jgi:hypothetical protein
LSRPDPDNEFWMNGLGWGKLFQYSWSSGTNAIGASCKPPANDPKNQFRT